MTEKEIRQEIARLERQIKPSQDRIRTLKDALHGAYVEPVIVLRDGDEEELYRGPYTIEAAFEELGRLRDGEPYGSLYDDAKVSVGGVHITHDEWHVDPRRPGGAEALAEQQRREAEKARVEAARLEAERERQELREQTTMALFSDDGQRVSEWVPFETGAIVTRPGWGGVVEQVRYMRDGRITHWSPVGRRVEPWPGTRISVSGRAMGVWQEPRPGVRT